MDKVNLLCSQSESLSQQSDDLSGHPRDQGADGSLFLPALIGSHRVKDSVIFLQSQPGIRESAQTQVAVTARNSLLSLEVPMCTHVIP